MMRFNQNQLLVVLTITFCAFFAVGIAIADYDLSWHRIAGGGETASTGGGYELAATIGQHDAGVMSGGGYSLAGGFWSAIANTAVQPPCPGNLNGDGEVNVSDLLQLLAAWGTNPGHPADLNGDGQVNVTDLLQLLAVWGPCPM